jgi:hypothetical protein
MYESTELSGDITLWEVTTSLRVSMNPKKGVVRVPHDDRDRFIMKLIPQVGSGESLDGGKALSVLWLTGLIEEQSIINCQLNTGRLEVKHLNVGNKTGSR